MSPSRSALRSPSRYRISSSFAKTLRCSRILPCSSRIRSARLGYRSTRAASAPATSLASTVALRAPPANSLNAPCSFTVTLATRFEVYGFSAEADREAQSVIERFDLRFGEPADAPGEGRLRDRLELIAIDRRRSCEPVS